MNPEQRIDHAFRQLDFAIKFVSYVERRKVELSELDSTAEVHIAGENVRVEGKTFRDYDDLATAAQKNFLITMGMTAAALESAFTTANIPADPRRLEPAADVRSVVWMICCAFRSDPMAPKWEIRTRFARTFALHLENVPAEVDLRTKDKSDFHIADIGGVKGYVDIKNEVKRLLSA